MRDSRSRALLTLLAVWLAWALPAAAVTVNIGGGDISAEYTNTGGVSGPGMLSFGSGPANWGWVSTEDILGSNCATGLLCTGKVKFDVLLDLSGGYNPALNKAGDAVFISAGPGPDFAIYEPGSNSLVALGFNVEFLDVTQVSRNSVSNPGGSLTFGDPVANAVTSRLVLTQGSANALLGGLGAVAWLGMRLPGLSPKITTRQAVGYFNANFASGIASPNPEVVWDLVVQPVPEPGTAVLLGFGLLAIIATARRSARPR